MKGNNMNIIKSTLVIITIFLLLVISIVSLKQIAAISHTNAPVIKKRVFAFIMCFVTVLSIIVFKDYTYPFERKVNFEHFATITIPPENELKTPGAVYWRAAYEAHGLYAESFYFNPTESTSPLGFRWPEMDFKNHTYIITYGQELLSLSYNVWETIDIPIKTGAKAGYAVLSNEFHPDKVFIYELPRIRIENDVNITTDFIRKKHNNL